MRQQTIFQLLLGRLIAERQELEVVRVAHDLVGQIRLSLRQRILEARNRLALARIQI